MNGGSGAADDGAAAAVQQPAEPRTNKRVREEENSVLASMSPKEQADTLAARIRGSASLSDDFFIQTYVGMYDDLILPPADKESMYDVGAEAVKALVRRISEQCTQGGSVDEIAIALTLLRIFTRLEENRTTVVSEGGIEALIKAMSLHEETIKIQEQATQALGNLAFHKPGRHNLPRTDSLKRITLKLEDLDKSSGDETDGSQSSSRRRDRRDAAKYDHRERVVSAGGMQQTLAAMRRHLTSRAVQRFGCRVILFLTVGSIRRQRAVAKMGGIQAVMLAMTAHPESESLQTYGCSCLNLLVRDPDVQHLVDHEAGIRGAVHMMQKWSESQQVARVGCMALSSLCCHSTERKVYASSLRAMDIILSFMQNEVFLQDREVQVQACYALWTLVTRCVQTQIEACDKKGVQCVVAAMTMHTGAPALQEYGCRVLGNLALSGETAQEAIVTHGGVDAILAALGNHLHNTDVQGAGCLALGFVAANNERTRALIAEKGCVEAVATSGQTHQNSVEVRGCVDIALYSLCGEDMQKPPGQQPKHLGPEGGL